MNKLLFYTSVKGCIILTVSLFSEYCESTDSHLLQMLSKGLKCNLEFYKLVLGQADGRADGHK